MIVKVTRVAKLVIFGAGDIARLAHFYSTDSVTRSRFASNASRHHESFMDLPLVAFDEVVSSSRPRCTGCSLR
jgi:hypothetical protein